MLAYENPTMPEREPHVAKAFEYVDKVFVCIYTAEMLFKIIADGFISTPIFDKRKWEFKNIYSDEQFREGWNLICQKYIKK